MDKLPITEIRVRPFNRWDDRLKAFVTITISNCFVITDLKVIQGPKGLLVAMPSRRKRDGKFRDIAHPLNQECRDEIERRVLAEYDVVKDKPIAKDAEAPVPKPRKVDGDFHSPSAAIG